MLKNPYFANLKKNYLFPEVERHVKNYLQRHPNAPLISLGVGDTVEPIPNSISLKIAQKSLALSTKVGYQGYGPSLGIKELRQKIANHFYKNISFEEITISDGAKPDLARLQMLFGTKKRVLIQDPSYPVYIDTSLIQGHEIHLLPCNKENNFFPQLQNLPPFDILFFCSPNNPTGHAATYEQLEELVATAKKHEALIVYDAAYSMYIQDPTLPKSIYEIPGSKEVAIEIHSFSKIANFTGIRLGWTVVPKELSLYEDWIRLISTAFNGASILSQEGGLGVLEHFKEIEQLIKETSQNVELLKQALKTKNIIGGSHAPYLFLDVFPKTSWEAFQDLLENYQLITTPGSGFGSQGEHYLRLTAFATRQNIKLAAERLISY